MAESRPNDFFNGLLTRVWLWILVMRQAPMQRRQPETSFDAPEQYPGGVESARGVIRPVAYRPYLETTQSTYVDTKGDLETDISCARER